MPAPQRRAGLRRALLALLVLALLGGAAAWWWLTRPGGDAGRAPGAPAPATPAGGSQTLPAPGEPRGAAPVLRRYALMGLSASGDPRSPVARALISVDGGPAKALTAGESVDGDLIVLGIYADHVDLGRAGGQPLVRLDMMAGVASAPGPGASAATTAKAGASGAMPPALKDARDPAQTLQRMVRGTGASDPLPGMMAPPVPATGAAAPPPGLVATPQRPQEVRPPGMVVQQVPSASMPSGMVIAPRGSTVPMPGTPKTTP